MLFNPKASILWENLENKLFAGQLILKSLYFPLFVSVLIWICLVAVKSIFKYLLKIHLQCLYISDLSEKTQEKKLLKILHFFFAFTILAPSPMGIEYNLH